MGVMDTKTCWDCREEKPADQFRKLYEGPNGPVRRGRCHACEHKHRVSTPDKRRKLNEVKNRSRKNLWLQTVEAYGGRCSCCDENEEAFLVIDHIEDNGAEHRKQQRPHNPKSWSGKALYSWLRQNGWPPGFQLLCANCNMAKTRKEGCPHGRQLANRSVLVD